MGPGMSRPRYAVRSTKKREPEVGLSLCGEARGAATATDAIRALGPVLLMQMARILRRHGTQIDEAVQKGGATHGMKVGGPQLFHLLAFQVW